MVAEHRLDIYSAAGVLREQIVGQADPDNRGGFLDLAYTSRVNETGLLTVTFDAEAAALAALEHRGQVEAYRRDTDNGIAWRCEFAGLYLDQERRYTDHGEFTATCPGLLWLLATRYVLYYAGTTNRSTFSNKRAETIMKTLVDYNASANATVANGRLRTPGSLGVTVEADGGGGNVVSIGCSWDNLLATLQKLASTGGGDYNLVKTAATTWEFRWYAGQLGTDRSADVTFALEYGNMRNPVYRKARTKEATVVIVAGRGLGDERTLRIRTGGAYSAANDIEKFVQANMLSAPDSLDAEGDRSLAEMAAEDEFDFTVMQSGAKLYGRDYFLGDLVKAKYETVEATRKILGVTINSRGDVVAMEFGRV